MENVSSPRPISLNSTWNFYFGLILSLVSTVFIGSSFIIKKLALIRLERIGTRASDGGCGYLRDWLWWLGLILMGIGEGANFIAYAFAPASLVTPLGGLSVLVTAVMSAKCLNEHLNLIGKLGCIVCLSGSTMVVIHAPKEQDINSMTELTTKFLNPAYITYACVIILLAMTLIFIIAPRIGKSNPLVYLSISGMIGSLSVMASKGIGVGFREMIIAPRDTLQSWLFWVLVIQLGVSIVVQMNYLNMALDIFNTNIVTPILYVIFTGSVLVASSVLFQEWFMIKPEDHLGNICGLMCIVSGIFLITAFRDLEVTWLTIREAMRTPNDNAKANKPYYNSKPPPPASGANSSSWTLCPLFRGKPRCRNSSSRQLNDVIYQSLPADYNNNTRDYVVLMPEEEEDCIHDSLQLQQPDEKNRFLATPWKRLYNNSQTHRRAFSIDSRQNQPEAESGLRMLNSNNNNNNNGSNSNNSAPSRSHQSSNECLISSNSPSPKMAYWSNGYGSQHSSNSPNHKANPL